MAGLGKGDEAVEMIPNGILAKEKGDRSGIWSQDAVDMADESWIKLGPSGLLQCLAEATNR